MGTVTIERAIGVAADSSQPSFGSANVSLEGTEKSAIGFTAGLHFILDNQWQFGLSYRSEVKYKFKGTATTIGAPAAFADSVPHGNLSASLTSPWQFVLGVGYQAMPKLLISADFQYIGWKTFDAIVITFDNPNQKKIPPSIRDYQNAWIARLGLEYKYTDNLAIRGGLLYDKNPVKDERVDPLLPDADRFGFCVGLGYKLSQKMNVDAGYMFLRFKERTITNSLVNYAPTGVAYFDGTYNSSADLISLSLTFNF